MNSMALLEETKVEGRLLSPREVSRYTPAEIREAISALVAEDRLNLAYPLGEAGLSLYPQSEDLLSINALLETLRQDWVKAEEYLRTLIAVQQEGATQFTWQMLVRVLRCQAEPMKALQAAEQGVQRYPESQELRAECQGLRGLVQGVTVASSAPQTRQ
jgi:hypothetical protein